MEDHVTSALAQNSAVLAFEGVRAEISLLRRAIEGLTAERRNQPDYGPTLEALVASNDELREWARTVSGRPAIQLTPEAIGEQIEAVAAQFREQDRETLAAASRSLACACSELKAISGNALSIREHTRWVRIVGGTCFLGGMFLILIAKAVQQAGVG